MTVFVRSLIVSVVVLGIAVYDVWQDPPAVRVFLPIDSTGEP